MLRSAAERLPEQIAARVAEEVPALAGRRRMRRKVKDAVTVAVQAFIEGASSEEAANHFAELGRARAEAGVGIVPVLHALQVGAGAVWDWLNRVAREEGLNGHVVAEVGGAVTGYLCRLGQAAEAGHNAARRAQADSRAVLFAALMGRRDERPLAEIAAQAEWDLPSEVVVLVADLHGAATPRAVALGADVLLRSEGDHLVAVCAPARLAELRRALLQVGSSVVVAESWAVPVEDARHGYRWARRALALARGNHLRPVGRVVRCVDHRLDLWINADRVLAESTSRDLLAPLLLEKPSQQRVLVATMLRMLETGEAAPAIAVHLKTHAQTIRHRGRRLQAMFGDRLDDPEHRMTYVLALRALFPHVR